jgi:hypothetical protein
VALNTITHNPLYKYINWYIILQGLNGGVGGFFGILMNEFNNEDDMVRLINSSF